MGTKIQEIQNYIGYIKCGEILKSPLQNYQNPFVLKCFQCAEIHFLLESFIIHIQEHCKDVVSSRECNETKTSSLYSNQEQVDSECAGVENQTIKLEANNVMEMEDPLIVVKNELDIENSTVKEEYELQETEISNKNFDTEYHDNLDEASVDSTDDFQPDDTETDEDEAIMTGKGLTHNDINLYDNYDWDDSDHDGDLEENEDYAADFEQMQDYVDDIKCDIDILKSATTDTVEGIMKVEKGAPEEPQPRKFKKQKLDVYKWRKKPMEQVYTNWISEMPEATALVGTPLDYFMQFIDDEIIEKIAEETNKFCMQKTGTMLNCKPAEIEQYFGCLLYFGVLKVPQFKMAWTKEMRLPLVADVMSRNRFDKIKQFLHFNDNSKQRSKDHPEYDKLYKIRPLIDKLKSTYAKIPAEEFQSVKVNEGRSKYKQNKRRKPNKWGFKVISRIGSSGIIYDFEIYVGSGTCEYYGLGFPSDIVLHLAKKLPRHQNFKLFFNNWFSSIALAIALKEWGILCIGTISSNMCGKCEMETESQLKAKGRGSYDYRVETTHNLATVRWYNTRAIQFISNYVCVEPTNMCRRWNGNKKQFEEFSQPAIIADHKRFMGEVDLADMMLHSYRINHKSTKYYMRIVYWCLGSAVVNSWLLYRRHMNSVSPKIKPMPLIQFQSSIADGLINNFKSVKVAGTEGNPSNISTETHSHECAVVPASSKSSRYNITPAPNDRIRFDGFGHWVKWEGRGRCRGCKTAFPASKCAKCGVYLCCNTKNNCFVTYHIIK